MNWKVLDQEPWTVSQQEAVCDPRHPVPPAQLPPPEQQTLSALSVGVTAPLRNADNDH